MKTASRVDFLLNFKELDTEGLQCGIQKSVFFYKNAFSVTNLCVSFRCFVVPPQKGGMGWGGVYANQVTDKLTS
ncbi:MAG: hypothetical protein D3903_05410 [Candidatus Electrothrix sp. GM3_4]|nr:hypothetical protein [Candidatus Electrothrix sp. GM3_4]